MKTKIIYVLVSNENDCYLEQALVSIYSLRLYNPDANLLLLVDEETSRTLENGIRKLILNYVSKLVIVDVPFHYSKQQKSRYIKTSLSISEIKCSKGCRTRWLYDVTIGNSQYEKGRLF